MVKTVPVNGGFPGLVENERTMLEQFLDFNREQVLAAVVEVDDEAAGRRWLPGTDLTIGGIVKHLARMENLWFSTKLDDLPAVEPWHSAPFDTDPDWDFHSGAAESIADLVNLYRRVCETSRQRAAHEFSLDVPSARKSFEVGPTSLRWIYLHMIEETAQHRGHLDLLIDASVRD